MTGESLMSVTESVRWKGRDATRLANGRVELIALTHGGHLAEFRFVGQPGVSSQNVLWESSWMAPGYERNLLEEQTETGGFTGHGLCLDYFGPPSATEAADLSIHGEAAARDWDIHKSGATGSAACRWNVHLPIAQLDFERNIHLQAQESVAYVEEIVTNQRDADHACHWVEHATFSPPFLNPSESTLAVSAVRGITSPTEYEGGTLLATDREFVWPYAPRHGAEGTIVDLRYPFSEKGYGFGAAVELDPERKLEFLLAMNWKLRLGVGYCFRRQDFPWMALWEENCARPGSPWNGNTQARGMEFGTTPLSVGIRESLRRGDIFNTPTWCVIPAHGQLTARYIIFLFKIPGSVSSIENVEVENDAIVLSEERTNSSFSVPAHGCRHFLLPLTS